LTRQAFPILDEGGHLVGLITRGEVLRALDGRSEAQPHQTVLQAGRSQVAVAYPDEVLSDAVARMLRDRLDRLPVVTRDDSSLYLGYLGRAEVLGARRRQLAEEQREPGWLHHAIHRNGSG
jgi:CBS domain-containing protein